MARWLAPLVAGLSLLVLLVGLVRAEAETATTAGVTLVFWGLAGLALAGAGAGLVEFTAARRAAHPHGSAPHARGPRSSRLG